MLEYKSIEKKFSIKYRHEGKDSWNTFVEVYTINNNHNEWMVYVYKRFMPNPMQIEKVFFLT